MNLEVSELPDGVRVLKLAGKLDVAGVRKVETQFYAHCGGEKPRLLVDLAAMDFVASLGIGLLMQAAKTAKARGGQMQFLNPQPVVTSALEISGLGQLIVRGDATDSNK